jgi:hypothetical protein
MASFVIVSLILWNTYTFFQIFKNEERLKMEVWANAQKSLINANETTDVDLPLQIFNNNTTIPLILMENNTIRSTANIDEKIVNDKKLIKEYLNQLKKENDPIVTEYLRENFNIYIMEIRH